MAASYFSRIARHCTSQPRMRATLSFFSTLSPSKTPQPFPTFRALRSAIKLESDPVKVAEIFESYSTIPTFRRHRPLFQLSVHKLHRAQRVDLIERILNQALNSSPSPPREGFWLRIIMLYSQAGMVDNALQVFDKMLQQKKCILTENSLCAILSVLLDNKIYDDKFHQNFQSVPPKIGVKPGVKSYNLVLKAFCKADRVDEARALLVKMETDYNVIPNIDSYNIVLGALKKTSEFNAVVKEILGKGLEPNLNTYNCRILRLCKNKECARARKLLDEMVSKGVKPDSASYNAIIFGFCKVGDLESARKVMEKMASDGFVWPTSFGHYTLMKHLVEEGEFDAGLEICKEILKRKWVPPFEATKGLVNGLVKISKGEDAKEIVEKVKKRLRGTALDSWGKIEADLLV